MEKFFDSISKETEKKLFHNHKHFEALNETSEFICKCPCCNQVIQKDKKNKLKDKIYYKIRNLFFN